MTTSPAALAKRLSAIDGRVSALSRTMQISRSTVTVTDPATGEPKAVPIADVAAASEEHAARLTEAEAEVAAAQASVAATAERVDQIQNGTLPELQEAIQIAQATADSTVKVHFEADLGAGVYPTLNDTSDLGDLYYRLDGQAERWQGSAIGWTLVEDTALTGAIADLRAAEEQITNLRDVELPALEADLAAADAIIAQHTTDLAGLDGRLTTAESDVSAARNDVDTLTGTTIPALQGDIDAKIPKQTGAILSTYIADDAITTPKIATGAVEAEQVAAGAIIAAKIGAGAVTAVKIEAGAVTAEKIQAGAIITEKLAAGAITAEKIEAGTITGDRIAAGTITSEKVIVASTESMIPWNMQATVDPHVGYNGATVTRVLDADLGWCMAVQGGSLADGTMGSAVRLMSGKTARTGHGGDFDVEAGGTYRMRVGLGVGGAFPSGFGRDVRISIAVYSSSTEYTWINSDTIGVGAYGADPNYLDFQFTLPANAVAIRPFIQKATWSNGTYFVLQPLLVRAASAELIVDGAITADKIGVGAVTAEKIQVGAITAGSAIIADGAITEAKIGTAQITNAKIAGGFDAAKITVGTLGADIIGAKTITADKVILSNTENLLVNPNFDNNGEGWSANALYTYSATDGANGEGSLLVGAATIQRGSDLGASNVQKYGSPVTPGRTYRLSAMARTASPAPASSIRIFARVYKEDGSAFVFATGGAGEITNAAPTVTNTYAEVAGNVTIPAGYTRLVMGLYVQPSYTSAVRFSTPRATLMAGADLVVDGAITAIKLGAEAVTAEKIAAGAITATKLAADAITGKTITGGTITGTAINGATMTGGVIQTAASGDRIVLDGAANSLTFETDGLPSPEVKAKTVVQPVNGNLQMQYYDGTGELDARLVFGNGLSMVSGVDYAYNTYLQVWGTGGITGRSPAIQSGTLVADERIVQAGQPIAYRQSAGVNSVPSVPANASVNVTAYLPSGRFTVAPIVTATPDDDRLTAVVTARSTTQLTIRLTNRSALASNPSTVGWTAVQMLSTAAEG
jgi:hypothetical protein